MGIHKPEAILLNETQKILWDFKIETDRLIPIQRLELERINNNNNNNNNKKHLVDFAVHVDQCVKIKESKKIKKYSDLAKEHKQTMEHETDGGNIFVCALELSL